MILQKYGFNFFSPNYSTVFWIEREYLRANRGFYNGEPRYLSLWPENYLSDFDVFSRIICRISTFFISLQLIISKIWHQYEIYQQKYRQNTRRLERKHLGSLPWCKTHIWLWSICTWIRDFRCRIVSDGIEQFVFTFPQKSPMSSKRHRISCRQRQLLNNPWQLNFSTTPCLSEY